MSENEEDTESQHLSTVDGGALHDEGLSLVAWVHGWDGHGGDEESDDADEPLVFSQPPGEEHEESILTEGEAHLEAHEAELESLFAEAVEEGENWTEGTVEETEGGEVACLRHKGIEQNKSDDWAHESVEEWEELSASETVKSTHNDLNVGASEEGLHSGVLHDTGVNEGGGGHIGGGCGNLLSETY